MTQNQPKTKVRKVRRVKANSIFSKSISFVLLVCAAYLLYSAGTEVYSTYQLSQSLNTAKERKAELEDENVYLKEQKEKLTNPEYVQSVARGQYQLSYESEQIFVLPSKKAE